MTHLRLALVLDSSIHLEAVARFHPVQHLSCGWERHRALARGVATAGGYSPWVELGTSGAWPNATTRPGPGLGPGLVQNSLRGPLRLRLDVGQRGLGHHSARRERLRVERSEGTVGPPRLAAQDPPEGPPLGPLNLRLLP